jgi:hypothetical protein
VHVVATEEKNLITAPNDNSHSDSRYECGFVPRTRIATPNELKLSDGRSGRAACRSAGKGEVGLKQAA